MDAAQRTVTELEVSPPREWLCIPQAMTFTHFVTANSDMMDAPRRRVAELKVTKHGMPRECFGLAKQVYNY